jgi:hypothetical protein
VFFVMTRLAILLILLLAAAGCAKRASRPVDVGRGPASNEVQREATPLDLTGATDDELRQHLGQVVTMRGQFSLRGKVGPFILTAGGRPVYLESKGSFSWGETYASMEGRDVRVTGTLRFVHYPEPAPGALPEGRASDHFYFEAETAKVEPAQK